MHDGHSCSADLTRADHNCTDSKALCMSCMAAAQRFAASACSDEQLYEEPSQCLTSESFYLKVMDAVQHVAELRLQVACAVAAVVHPGDPLIRPLKGKLVVREALGNIRCQALSLNAHQEAHLHARNLLSFTFMGNHGAYACSPAWGV